MIAGPFRVPVPSWFTAADLGKCRPAPEWAQFLLSAVPPDYPATKLVEFVKEAKESARDRLKVLASSSLLGSAWGPVGTVIGGLLGLKYALEDRPEEIGWRQQSRIANLDQARVQQWVEKPGAPWTEDLPGGSWVDRRYRTSEFLPVYECERTEQGEALRIGFRFRAAYFEHRLGTGFVEVRGPQERVVNFDAQLDDSSGEGVRIELPDQGALLFQLDGQAFYLPVEPEIVEVLEGCCLPEGRIPLVTDLTVFDCPFPLDWLSAS